MRGITIVLVGLGALALTTAASATTTPAGLTNTVVSTPSTGGGYPVPAGSNAPVPGTCGAASFNSNYSESWLAVKPGTENIVGVSKFFVDRYSTFYDFYLGAFTILGGAPVSAHQIQGYDCTTVGTQAMPPSWTNDTDPNVAFDTRGRAYGTQLPFNAYWVNLHPNSEITVSYSDDMGRNWTTGNGGQPLEQSPNNTATTLGHVEDKQWIAVNNSLNSRYADHVYAMWTVFNGSGPSKIKVAVSRDRGQTFSKAVTLTEPKYSSPANTYVYPSIGSDGTVYVAFVGGFDTKNKNRVGSVYVTRSNDDGQTFTPFVQVASPVENPTGTFQNTPFRDGIIENFAASPTYPGHAYLTYESWDTANGTMDVYFTQSTDGGFTWSAPALVNDDPNTGSTDQFQPSVAAGTGGAVAVAFYDRRAVCPSGSSVLPQDVGAANTCIGVSLQAYRDSGSGAVAVGGNVSMSTSLWDPNNPGQKVGGLSQYPCAGHSDPCPAGTGFIGDYFGLAVSDTKVYTLSVSTHYPSGVTADGGGPVYYQQQVLGAASRAALGIG
jgi:hypothetical protein